MSWGFRPAGSSDPGGHVRGVMFANRPMTTKITRMWSWCRAIERLALTVAVAAASCDRRRFTRYLSHTQRERERLRQTGLHVVV